MARGTIAAESQRLINKTYSTFVQGFMPTLARAEVGHLEGITMVIIADQEPMGANPRSTVGAATDATAMLRILFSRIAEPSASGPGAYFFNVPSMREWGVPPTLTLAEVVDRAAILCSAPPVAAPGWPSMRLTPRFRVRILLIYARWSSAT